MGDGAFGTGERYERLAVDGLAGSRLPGWGGRGLDCDRIVYRDGPELDPGIGSA